MFLLKKHYFIAYIDVKYRIASTMDGKNKEIIMQKVLLLFFKYYTIIWR
jgi:hypothetical protein